MLVGEYLSSLVNKRFGCHLARYKVNIRNMLPHLHNDMLAHISPSPTAYKPSLLLPGFQTINRCDFIETK